MEKLEQYRNYVKQVITEYAQLGSAKDEIEQQLIFDTFSDHYQLMYVGWKNRKRQHGCVLHLDIKDQKIWIQHDGTEIGIADELVKLGVPKSDIVLAFHEPLVRQYTDFAVG
ncbi:XisI protein [Dolichospermum sp. ST_con]|nr:XisI protein [Dolichospermum sp. DET66]MBS3030901.1 XisI protein [Dolichospermum sp. DET67]MBS3036111.1 XisI protein [Dolichospermum sp. DET50]MDD1414233.1 XisI protein [Dolichospermum sp. ST_con]MDD1419609.1 XisI protein [Dolichospermum sp. ST_sed1]MDD1422907.1 XisI protein [Dolichospermum sp. ST_sed9]MDD1430662.1 XisI protein [Dolichospermum sp. ST_sed6]MDD1438198.1 XisI protein [Dolichospermum sp. ST_sed10]MDD1439456.1 XisI protein [Dolichospermum sp. ST_sed3]MDD1445849.1 XisI protei